MSPAQYAIAAAVLAVGATLQGAVGFGCNLVAAPVLVMIDPTLVPGPLIAANLTLNTAMVRRESEPGAWREARWPILGQFPGTVAGAAALVATRNLTTVLAITTLMAVGLSMTRLTVRRTPGTLAAAGVLSGFMGTVAGIGGPPVALLYQRATGAEIRARISRFFLVSGLCSATVLAGVDRFDLLTMARGAILVPGTALGYALSGRLLGRVERRHVRGAVLAISSASALVALARGAV